MLVVVLDIDTEYLGDRCIQRLGRVQEPLELLLVESAHVVVLP